jgi:hypothetical protein
MNGENFYHLCHVGQLAAMHKVQATTDDVVIDDESVLREVTSAKYRAQNNLKRPYCLVYFTNEDRQIEAEQKAASLLNASKSSLQFNLVGQDDEEDNDTDDMDKEKSIQEREKVQLGWMDVKSQSAFVRFFAQFNQGNVPFAVLMRPATYEFTVIPSDNQLLRFISEYVVDKSAKFKVNKKFPFPVDASSFNSQFSFGGSGFGSFADLFKNLSSFQLSETFVSFIWFIGTILLFNIIRRL